MHLAHDHVFDHGKQAAERGTRLVMWITAVNDGTRITDLIEVNYQPQTSG
ncbi:MULTISPECIES: hypothetical protein [unclassified Duganella]|nr:MULTISPECIES: hypothetical protein [unclassified Duganella]SDG71628.1 hypothetical protein SAMN05216320_106280 [Duganella sp. OV458]SDJ97394.1 hypothetical protein SAMN05428973_107281 [Duganella sp. OV510]